MTEAQPTETTETPAVTPAVEVPETANVDGPDSALATEETGFKFKGEIDREKAEALITNLKKTEKSQAAELAELKSKLAEYERAHTTEVQKLQADYEAAQKELANLKREMALKDVISKYNLPEELTQFVTGDNAEEMEAKAQLLAEKIAATPAEIPGKPKLRPTPGNGAADDTPGQLTREDLNRMSPDEIVAARAAGRLNEVMGVK